MGSYIFWLVTIIIAALIYIDANKLKRSGLKISPLVWSLSIFIFSIFILIFYLIMRYAVWKVQLKAILEPGPFKRSPKSIIIRRLSITSIVIVCFSVFAGCHIPYLANVVHNKIKIGMPVREVTSILSKYKGFSPASFNWCTVLMIDAAKAQECARIKPEYELCAKDYSVDCGKKFPNYRDDCEGKMYQPEEFVKILEDTAHKNIKYAAHKAEISVLYMGPVFLHNSFKIYFNSQGKVESVTPVKRWD